MSRLKRCRHNVLLEPWGVGWRCTKCGDWLDYAAGVKVRRLPERCLIVALRTTTRALRFVRVDLLRDFDRGCCCSAIAVGFALAVAAYFILWR